MFCLFYLKLKILTKKLAIPVVLLNSVREKKGDCPKKTERFRQVSVSSLYLDFIKALC